MLLFHQQGNLRIHRLRLGLSRNGIMELLTYEEDTILAIIALTAFIMANSTIKAL